VTVSLDELTSAYEGFEELSSFVDRQSLEKYREVALENTQQQADFLGERLPDRAMLLELGCGNGRLLVELARRRRIAGGLGVDLSRSRIAFARAWAGDEGLEQLRFEAGDAATFDFADVFSAAVCITGAFAYFDAVEQGLARWLLDRTRQALVPGGLLCLELYPHPHERRLVEAAGGEVRIWKELPPADPWRFYLSTLALDSATQVLTHEKTFVHRTTGEVDSGRRERLLLYTSETIAALLRERAFRDIQVFGDWEHGEASEDSELLVVTAAAPGSQLARSRGRRARR